MANVLKVFLENGQTKSFKYDSTTNVRVSNLCYHFMPFTNWNWRQPQNVERFFLHIFLIAITFVQCDKSKIQQQQQILFFSLHFLKIATIAQDVVISLRDKLCLSAEEHFSLVLEHVKSLKRNKLTLLDPDETLARVSEPHLEPIFTL